MGSQISKGPTILSESSDSESVDGPGQSSSEGENYFDQGKEDSADQLSVPEEEHAFNLSQTAQGQASKMYSAPLAEVKQRFTDKLSEIPSGQIYSVTLKSSHDPAKINRNRQAKWNGQRCENSLSMLNKKTSSE